jgi:hypothetical protein
MSIPFERKGKLAHAAHSKGRVASLVRPLRKEGQHRLVRHLKRMGNITHPPCSKGRKGNFIHLNLVEKEG